MNLNLQTGYRILESKTHFCYPYNYAFLFDIGYSESETERIHIKLQQKEI